MKRTIIAIVAALAATYSIHAQSPTPTPTPSPTPGPQRITAMVESSEVVSSGSVPAVIASLPTTTTLPDGTVLTLRGYQVTILSGTNGNCRVSSSYVH